MPNNVIPHASRRELGALLNVGEFVLVPAESAPAYPLVHCETDRGRDDDGCDGVPQYCCTCKSWAVQYVERRANHKCAHNNAHLGAQG